MNKTKWPPKEECENLRWTNNHTRFHSFAYGFCEAQDCCEECDFKIRLLCKIKRWIEEIKGNIIKHHYKLDKGEY